MVAPRQQRVASTSSAYNATDVLVGGLPDGYFVTADIDSGAGTHVLYLRSVTDMGTALDSVSCSYKFFPGDELTQYGALTANGDVFYMRDVRFTSDPTSFYRVSQSGGTLVVDEIGPVDIEPSAPGYLLASHDGTQLVVVNSTTGTGYNATTGVQEYEIDLSTTLGTSNLLILAAPLADHLLVYNQDTTRTILVDSAGTDIDSTLMSGGFIPALYSCAPTTGAGLMMTVAINTTTLAFNVLDCDVVGGTVDWRFSSSSADYKSITVPAWTGWSGVNLATRLGTYGDTCVLTMRDRTGTYSDRSIYWIDLETGDYTTSYITRFAANGAYAINMCGADATVLWGLDLGTWSGWSTDAVPPVLRQRQSPKRTPSRVRDVDLRQRQTPYIT